jgi:UDP-N-acetylmuramoyl-tripeptide--D-alanyl-D-alanine ligase
VKRKLRNALNLLKYRAMLVAAFCWRRLLFRTRFIAITGSVGKTTTKNLLAEMLSEMPARTVSTRHSANGVKHIARDILRVRPWHRFVVLETGTSRAGWIARSTWLIRPDVAIILAVARTHTNNFRTLEETAAEKAALLSGLRRNGLAILNRDDFRVAAMAKKCPARVLWFGSSPEADLRVTSVSARWPERLSMTITTKGQTQKFSTQLVGTHWTASVLAAVSAALGCGMDLNRAAQLISQIKPTPARMEPCLLPCGATILRDDVNGSLDTFLVAFEALKASQAQRKILVITTVGDSPESWDHRLMRIAAESAGAVDMLVLAGKRKDTKRARNAAMKQGLPAEALHEFETLRELSGFLKSTLRFGDLVLLRGRTTDHMARVYHAQLKEVTCWKTTCSERMLCDNCPKLCAHDNQAPVTGVRLKDHPGLYSPIQPSAIP